MKNKSEKFIILENTNQTLEYLKKIKKFEGVTPITFAFEAEELLLRHKIDFKIGEKYGIYSSYKNIRRQFIKLTKEICKRIDIKYRRINLFQLFYQDLIYFLKTSIKDVRILKEIKNKEKIKEIIIFKNINQDPNNELYSKIATKIFKNNLKVIKYKPLNKKNQKLIKFVGHIQNIASKIKLNLVKKKENKIFFCGNKNTFENVIKELSKNKKNKIFRCSNSLQKSFFVDRKYIPFYKFSGVRTNHQKKLIEDIESFNKKTKNFRFLNKFDIDRELIPVLKKWIRYYLKFRFLEISGIINQMIRLIEKNKIDFILLYSDINVFEKTFAQVGNMFNIPSIVIQHGITGNKLGFLPKSADYMLVFGNESKKHLIKFGYPKKNIIITGSPQFDKYVNQKIKINKQNKVVFIMGASATNIANPETDISKEKWKDVYEMLFKALKKFPDYKLIIKWKNKGDLDKLPKIIAEEENFQNMEIITDINPVQLLSDADMVILTDSTMAFDALLLNKPVISINFKELEKFFSYKDAKPIKTVHNQKELESAIRKSKKQTKKELLEIRKYLKEELFKLDGKASDRVVNFISKLLLKKIVK